MATQAREGLRLEALRSLPLRLLRPSALVDFVLFFACGKPAIRLIVDEADGLRALAAWSERWGFDFASDGEGFACVGRGAGSAALVLEIDRRAEAHETALGLALGYPLCCCERVASVGESDIDAYAAEVAGWPFEGDYRRINPSGYRAGRSLVSHLPCSPACEASLAIANRAHAFVLEHAREPMLTELYRSTVVSA